MATFVFFPLRILSTYKNDFMLPVLSGAVSGFFFPLFFITELFFEFSNYTQPGYFTEMNLLADFRTAPFF